MLKNKSQASQLWIWLHVEIDEMVHSPPVPAPPSLGLLLPVVSPLEDREAILTSGLSPYQCLHQVVWVKDNGPPTKYWQCLLSWVNSRCCGVCP